MKKIFFAFIFSLFFSFSAFAQNLQASVNRSEVPLGETFLLILEYDGPNVNENPDFSVLETDFTIYSVSNAFHSSSINGNIKQTRQWQVALIAKKPGELTIPQISLGRMKSSPINLKITEAMHEERQPTLSKDAEFSLKAEVDNTSPYVQQQLNYTLNLYETGGLQGREPQPVEDGKNDWIIKSSKQPTVETRVINGKSVRKISFHYALFPQKSGRLELPRFVFEGFYLTPDKQLAKEFEHLMIAGFGNINFGLQDVLAVKNPVVLYSPVQSLEVKPAPEENQNNWWLPASKVEIVSSWENNEKPKFKAYEAFRRDIIIKAKGVNDTQLPNIKFEPVEGMKQYPEKAVSETGLEQDELVAVKKISNVYIPQKEGKFILPSIKLHWFNTGTNQLETAVLPRKIIKVAPADIVVDSAEKTPAKPKAAPIVEIKKETLPYYAAFFAFIFGGLIGYLLFGRKIDKSKNKRHWKKAIVSAAKTKNCFALKNALLNWGALRFAPAKINNLGDLVKICKNKEFEREINSLNRCLYAGKNNDFNFERFLKIFAKIKNKKISRSSGEPPIPKLYK